MKLKLIVLIAFVALGAWAGIANSVTWLDKQTIPQISSSRLYLLALAEIYPLLPIGDVEKNVVRTIKLAHLVSTSRINNKSVQQLANDFADSFQLLTGLMEKKYVPDQAAHFEIALERLILFNRMKALTIAGGRSISRDSIDVPVIENIDFSHDNETRRAAKRELTLLRILSSQQDAGLNSGPPTSQIDAVDSLHFGLGMCATNNAKGAKEIHSAIDFLEPTPHVLIYIINRNIDHPLIAAANSRSNIECGKSIERLLKVLGN